MLAHATARNIITIVKMGDDQRSGVSGQGILQFVDLDAALAVRLGMLRLEQAGNAVEILSHRIESDAVVHPPDRTEPPGAPVRDHPCRTRRRDHHRGDPHVGVERQACEIRRHDADDGKGPIVQLHGLLEHVASGAELSLPQRVTDHRHRVAIHDGVLFGKEGPPQIGARSQYRKVRCRDHLGVDTHRFAADLKVEGNLVVDRHVGERAVQRSPVGNLRERSASRITPRTGNAGKRDQAIGTPEGERTQDHGVQQTEDHRRGRNANPKGKDDGSRVGGPFDQGARSDDEVVKHKDRGAPGVPREFRSFWLRSARAGVRWRTAQIASGHFYGSRLEWDLARTKAGPYVPE